MRQNTHAHVFFSERHSAEADVRRVGGRGGEEEEESGETLDLSLGGGKERVDTMGKNLERIATDVVKLWETFLSLETTLDDDDDDDENEEDDVRSIGRTTRLRRNVKAARTFCSKEIKESSESPTKRRVTTN